MLLDTDYRFSKITSVIIIINVVRHSRLRWFEHVERKDDSAKTRLRHASFCMWNRKNAKTETLRKIVMCAIGDEEVENDCYSRGCT